MESNRPPAKPTIRDVARRARVSVGTVSHVLNGSRAVREDTRQRVERAITELRYRPNRLARALVRQRTGMIGMIIPDVTNPFFATLLRGVEDALVEFGYGVIFGNSDNQPLKEQAYLDAFRERRVDAVILTPVANAESAMLQELARELPLILVDRLLPEWEGDYVVCDNRTGMRLAVEHLVRLGHQRIALVNGNPLLSTGRERRAGFLEAMAAHGLKPFAVSDGMFTLESGYAQAMALFQQRERPTAICAGNDLIALGVLVAARACGLSIPADLSLTGFDDIASAELTSPELTTIRQPTREIGAEAARAAIRRIGGESPVSRIVMPVQLVVRKSTVQPTNR
jgi:DNA-binding LacI/PurR family transcriptional regulator